MTEIILGIIAALGGLVLILFKRLQTVKKQRDENKQAINILKQDAKTDQTIEDYKNEVDKENTADELNAGFDKLRKYGKEYSDK